MDKRYDITCDTDICRAGVICFTESHLSANDKLTPSVIGLCNNTEIYRCDRDNNGGGVVICVDSKYRPTVLCVSESGLELVAIQINIPDRVTIFCTYRPPTYNCETFLQKLCNVLDHYADNPLCIVGDFNEDILENGDKVIHKTFLNAGFTQHVKVPTRDSGTLLDHANTMHITFKMLKLKFAIHITVTMMLYTVTSKHVNSVGLILRLLKVFYNYYKQCIHIFYKKKSSFNMILK